jgi:hypothetical protein
VLDSIIECNGEELLSMLGNWFTKWVRRRESQKVANGYTTAVKRREILELDSMNPTIA